MIRLTIMILLLLAIPAAPASTGKKPLRGAECSGWKDAAGSCHWEPPVTHGLGGSRMGPRGMVSTTSTTGK